MGVDIEPELPGAYRVGDVRHTVSGIAKIGRLGWKPTKHLRDIFEDYLSWLDSITDVDDYFSPAYAVMKQSGVVRMVQGHNQTGRALEEKAAWAQSSR
jgi:hypothetical protein